MKELLDEYVEKFCKTCKREECPKGIVFVEYNDMKQAMCVDYENDNTSVGYKKLERVTAKRHKPLMRDLV